MGKVALETFDGTVDCNQDQDPPEPGRYIDGDGLMMEIAPGGSRSWKLRVRVDGKRRDFGLGSLSIVTLTEAREKACEYRRLNLLGLPLIDRGFILGFWVNSRNVSAFHAHQIIVFGARASLVVADHAPDQEALRNLRHVC